MAERRNSSSAVREQRKSPVDALDFWPTPHWGTRALVEAITATTWCGAPALRTMTAWDPACGKGDMVAPLREYFGTVYGSDVWDYGQGFPVGDFQDRTLGTFWTPPEPDWIITNPPFNLATGFAWRALELARVGVAFLLRTAWLEGQDRWRLFSARPLHVFCPFVERLNLVPGCLDPRASVPTAYAVYIWLATPDPEGSAPRLHHIAPCKARLSRPEDWTGPSAKGVGDG